MLKLGFTNLPNILWRKQTNAPNKFMGSGMMPPGAYVTLEHEHILIFRNGGKRQFNSQKEKTNRRQSAFFWEERNQWFSDVWMDLKGARQKIADKQAAKTQRRLPV
jgi:DNA modification methylase